jgi:NAD(P)H dehydrogenase (quinone)
VIGVTAATGGVGSRVVRHLLARADCAGVAALARRPDAVPAAPGLPVRHADYDDPASLRAAFAGLRTLVFISGDGVADKVRRQHDHVVTAIAAAGVERVVYTSILDVEPDSRFYYSAGHRETEAWLAATGARTCFARTSIFADFFLETWLAGAELAVPAGDGGMSLVTRADTARAVAALAASEEDGVVDITGPEALTAAQIATQAGLPCVALDDAEYRRRLTAEGNPGWLIEAFASMFASVREGRFAAVSDAVPRLTGRAAETFADFLSRVR